jgi:LuxR family maltose regulon positive regulatory protein
VPDSLKDALLAHTATDDRAPAALRLVPRSALFGCAVRRGPAGVLLVCAPAGSGKTVLLRSWTDGLSGRVVWVSVERDEADAQHFWLSVAMGWPMLRRGRAR